MLAHENGTCDPCVFFSTRIGCGRGQACRYCHLEHSETGPGRTSHRPRKQTRDKFKATVQELLQKGLPLADVHDDLQAEARKSPYVRKLLQGYLDEGKPFDDGTELQVTTPSFGYGSVSQLRAGHLSTQVASGDRPVNQAAALGLIAERDDVPAPPSWYPRLPELTEEKLVDRADHVKLLNLLLSR